MSDNSVCWLPWYFIRKYFPDKKILRLFNLSDNEEKLPMKQHGSPKQTQYAEELSIIMKKKQRTKYGGISSLFGENVIFIS